VKGWEKEVKRDEMDPRSVDLVLLYGLLEILKARITVWTEMEESDPSPFAQHDFPSSPSSLCRLLDALLTVYDTIKLPKLI